MTDADLIYNACLRAERKLDLPPGTHVVTPALAEQMAAFRAVRALREAIGSIMTEERR